MQTYMTVDPGTIPPSTPPPHQVLAMSCWEGPLSLLGQVHTQVLEYKGPYFVPLAGEAGHISYTF